MHSELYSQILKIKFPRNSKVPEKLDETSKISWWVPQAGSAGPVPQGCSFLESHLLQPHTSCPIPHSYSLLLQRKLKRCFLAKLHTSGVCPLSWLSKVPIFLQAVFIKSFSLDSKKFIKSKIYTLTCRNIQLSISVLLTR